MTATYEQIITEANRRAAEPGWGARPVEHLIIEVVREGWTPPEPVDPDVLAVRGVLALRCNERVVHDLYLAGTFDNGTRFQMALAAYKAGKAAQ
jgi:hypothetical protein